MNEIKIRTALSEDSSEIADICISSLGYDCSRELVCKKLSGIDNERERVFVAVSNEKVVGFVHGEKYDVLYFETLVNILGIAVANDHKHEGIGRRLMMAIEDWARQIGAAGIRLNSGETRADAHKFYRAIGFDDEKLQLRFNMMFK